MSLFESFNWDTAWMLFVATILIGYVWNTK